MKKVLLSFLLTILLPISLLASHIIGSELTYRCLGGGNYEISLKLYRDCFYGGPQLPNPENIYVYDSLGNEITASPFSFVRLTYDSLDVTYGNICFTPPNDICVQEATYLDTVNLPPIPGGYQLKWSRCCRNESIDNVVVNGPGDVPASVFIEIPMYESPIVDSTGPNSASTDNEGGSCGNSGWTPTAGNLVASDNDYDSIFVNNMDNGDRTCYLEAEGFGFAIPANAIIKGIVATVEKRTNSVGDVEDRRVRIIKNGSVQGAGSDHANAADWPATDSVFTYGNSTDLWGTTWTPADINAANFGVVIQPQKVNGGTEDVTFWVDHVTIKVYYSLVIDLCNSSPQYNTFPPIFICLGDTLIYDHSANDTITDSDGDSLVYSVCEAWENTVTTFTPVPWDPPYDNSYQLSGDTMNIDPVTGELWGFPTSPGQYLIAICVEEWRNDTLLSTNLRDFQFNVVTCIPIISASVPSPKLPCGGTTVSFQNDSAGAFTYNWDFGVPIITTDTSTQPAPTYTYPDTGTYTATLIINQGMTCADTGTALVDLTPSVNANFSASGGCLGTTTTFIDSSTTTFGSIATWSWDFGDASTSTAQNPTHTYADSGTYTVTLVATNDSACADTLILVVTIYPLPVVDPGTNGSICSVSSVPLAGIVQFAGGGTWTTSGTGTFSPDPDSLNATYNPSVADTTAGSVTLTLTSTGNPGGCPADVDSIVVGFSPAPVSNAGLDLTVCADTAGVQLSGSVTNAASGFWFTSGSGNFNPDTVTWNATYIPSAADTTAGSVQIVLITTGNGLCIADSDTVVITISTAPNANAGSDATICSDSSGYQLSGSVTVASGGVWTTSGTGTFNDSSLLTAIYTPSLADTTAGSVTLSITSTGNGLCNATSDFMVLTFDNATVANAGIDQSLCSGSVATMAGSVGGNATTLQWTTSGTGTFNDDTDAFAIYTASGADVSSGSVTITITTNDPAGPCGVALDSMVLSFDLPATTSAGGDATICEGSSHTLSGTIGGSASTIIWTTSGDGTFDDSTLLAATYTLSAADGIAGTVTLTITTDDPAGACVAANDIVVLIISPTPVTIANIDQTVCANNADVTLAGSVANAGGGIWTTMGSGTFADSSVLNTIYTPSLADTTAGSVTLILTSTANGVCSAVSDSIVVTITPAPTVNAGSDQTRCANNPIVLLSGNVTVASGVVWTTSGTGTFDDSSLVNAAYSLSPADTVAGTVTLTLTSIGNGSCLGVSDFMVVTIDAGIYANAGADDSVCSNNPIVSLLGTVSGGTSTGFWSTSGSGTFSPDTSTLVGTYTPSVADIAVGTVTITLTSSGNGACFPVTDDFIITITAPPTAVAGVDDTVCANVVSVALAGSVVGATGGTWSTLGSGTFSPSTDSLITAYVPSAGDTLAGSVILILTTTGNGDCLAAADAVTITFTYAPVVSAGLDQSVCADNPTVTLAGTVSVATGGIWTGGTGSFTPDANTLTATYVPSAAEISAGTATLILTSTGNANCLAELDTIVINIAPIPIVNAGSDTTVCSDGSDVQLAGLVTNATGGIWTTSGTGTFDNASLLNAIYTTSSADSAAGSVILTLTSTGNGTCNTVSDIINISFLPGILVNANADTTVCLADTFVVLTGSVSGSSTTGQWASLGGGTFVPSDTILNTSYYFSIADMQSGAATLYLTSTGNGPCTPIIDSMHLTIIPGVNAGPDTIVCNTADTIQLNGTIDNISVAQWSSSGTGVFVPSDTVLTPQYVMTAADIASGSIVFNLTSSDTAGLCPSGTDSMLVSIIPPSTASAGADATVCEDTAGYALVGSFSNATGSLWSSSGAGVFLPAPDSLSVIYVPDSAGVDTIMFSVTGSCNNASDTILLNITPAPTVNGGGDTSVCATIFNVALQGSITTATGGVWSTLNGNGTFTPSDTVMNPTYNGTSADTATGTILIVLTSTGNGDCNTYTDTISLTYTPSLIAVDAGADTAICNNTSGIALNGTVVIATGGTWTTSGSGTFSPSPDSLITTYIPSAADTLAGALTLTLTTTGNGGCAGLSDALLVNFFSAPLVTAGADTTVCYTTDTVFLSGVFSNAGGVIWTTSGTGVFSPNDSTPNAGYVPSTGDFLNETVTLYLSTYQSCYDIVDSIKIDIVPGVLVYPSDTIICNNVDTVPINGIVTGAAGGIWATSGSGSFFPNDTAMSTNYLVSPADSSAGTVIITLTTTGVLMGCPPVTDVLNIMITPPPTVLAGADVLVCSNVDSVLLNGSTSNAGGVWSSSGTGIFTPDSITLNAIYVLSAADTASGLVVLTLSTTGSCMDLSDSLTISISFPPAVDFSTTDACLGDINTFTDNTPGTITGWSWDFGESGTNVDTSNQQNPTYTYSTAGTFTITLTALNQNGCSDSTTNTVTVNPIPVLSYDWVDVCDADSMQFWNTSTIPSPDVISSYSWDFGDESSSTDFDSTSHVYTNNGIYIVTLSATSGSGCTSSWDTIVVVSPNPVANFDADPILVSTEEEINFTDLSLGSNGDADTIDITAWEWNFYYPENVAGGVSSQTNPAHLYGDTGMYTIQLVVTNQYGCTDTTYEDVEVGLNPIVASGFSPDGSGENGNNILVVHGGPYQQLQFIIYNEWGAIIFESNSQDIGWDGTFDGVPQPIGVYVYTVIATSLDGVTHHFWGDVTLLR